MKKKQTSLLNSKGKEIPVELIRNDQLKKHQLVENIFTRLFKLQNKMESEKQRMTDAINNYQEYLAKKNLIDDPKFNNLTLSNYDNTKKIEIKSNRVLEFDEKLALAKMKIDKCVVRWTDGANAALKILIDGVFKVDQKGYVNKALILSLFQYKIKDQDWNDAMDIIHDSMQVVDRRSYASLKYRADVNSEWKTIDLNFSTAERN